LKPHHIGIHTKASSDRGWAETDAIRDNG